MNTVPRWDIEGRELASYINFSFDEVGLNSDVNLVVIIYNVSEVLDEMSFRPLHFTLCILEFSRFRKNLHLKNPRLLKSAFTFIICKA